MPPEVSPDDTPTPPVDRPPFAALRTPALVLALAALALTGWQWWETRARLAELQQEVAHRLAEGDAVAKEGRTLAKQGQEALAALQAKVGSLETQLAEAQGQQIALEAMYQELSKSRDERLIAEIEQAVAIAAQQLQLAGNVETALIALQGAESRLARSGQPQFLPLRKLIARDIEKLKALPTADVSGIALRLDGVASAIDGLPLAYEQRPRAEPAPRPGDAPAQDVWSRLGREVWQELRQLVRIERIDHPEPGLLSPSQSFFLRENLKLRLVNARLALLVRDGRAFREDIRQAREWLERYFDTHAKPVQAALGTLKSLAAADIAVEPPTLAETLVALRNFRMPRDRNGAR